jgi:hypothetical protein
MPSLIYITRIQPLSAELAQALESSGSHVKSFGPGEITADECILVMTSEAVLAGLRVPGLAPGHARVGAQSPQYQAIPPLPDLQRHLGTEAAVWNSIKAAELGESTVVKTTAGSGPRPSIPAVVRADDELGFVPSQAGLRVLASAQQKAIAVPQVLPAVKEKTRGSERNPGVPLLPSPSTRESATAPGKVSTLLLKRTGLADRIRSVNRQRYRRFWQPAAVAAALMVLALVLLDGRASVLPSKAEVAATEPTPQASIRPGTSTNPPNLPEAQRHKSDDDFVAADYTTRFDRHGHPRTTLQTPDLRPGAQSRLTPKRIVVD